MNAVPPTAEPDTTALTRHLPWKEVVADQPWVFRDAAVGAGVVVASGLYLWWAATSLPLRLPDGWEGLGSGIEIVAGIVAVVAVLAVVLGGFLLTQPLTERRLLRVRRFAADNGLEYRANGAPPPPVGVVFGTGLHIAVTNQLRSPEGRRIRGRTGPATVGVTIGDATLSERSASGGAGKTRGSVGFVHVSLPTRSPHLLLDGVANNGGARRGIARTVEHEQLVSLEGDFDRHFALYVPRDFQVEALQVFTPDVMALLIDHGRRWDIEIVDDNLFVTTSGSFRLWDASEMLRLFRFIDLVVPKLGGRIARMSPVTPRPSRFDAGTTRGARLRPSRNWVLVPVLVVAGLVVGAEILVAVLD